MDQTLVRGQSATLASRRAMVNNQVRTFDVTDQPLLDRFYNVPREMFLPASLADLAYSDAVLTVAAGDVRRPQLIPMVLARLLQGAAIKAADRVLVVGGGTGYAAAIVAGLADDVTDLESDAGFAVQARESFERTGLAHIQTATGKLAAGYPQHAPYHVIVVPGAVECNLEALLSQLRPGGRLVTIEKQVFDSARRSAKAVIHERFGEEFSTRALFDASAPVIDEFQQPPTFTF